MSSISPYGGSAYSSTSNNDIPQQANDLNGAIYQAVASQPWGQQFWDQYEASQIPQALAGGYLAAQNSNAPDVYAGLSSNDLQGVKNALYNIVAESPLAQQAWDDLYNAGLVPNPDASQGSAQSTTASGGDNTVAGGSDGTTAGAGGTGATSTYTGGGSYGGAGAGASSTLPATGGAGTTSVSSTTTSGTAGTAGGLSTSDGYTVSDCIADMKKLAAATGKQVPDDGALNQLATGIIQGVNANFSGQNTIGNFASVPGSDMAKMLVVSAFQESDFNLYGEDSGGVFQTAQVRLDQYNQAHGTNITEDQLQNNIPLAAQVGTWCMSTVIGTLGQQAGNDPIPSSLGMQALYYWNYHPGGGHGHADELGDYMADAQTNYNILGGT